MCCSSWLLLLSQVGSLIPESKHCITTLASDVGKLRDTYTPSLRYTNCYFNDTHTLCTLPFVWPSIVRDAAVFQHLSLLGMSYHTRHLMSPWMHHTLNTHRDVHSRAERLLYDKVRKLTVNKLKGSVLSNERCCSYFSIDFLEVLSTLQSGKKTSSWNFVSNTLGISTCNQQIQNQPLDKVSICLKQSYPIWFAHGVKLQTELMSWSISFKLKSFAQAGTVAKGMEANAEDHESVKVNNTTAIASLNFDMYNASVQRDKRLA